MDPPYFWGLTLGFSGSNMLWEHIRCHVQRITPRVVYAEVAWSRMGRRARGARGGDAGSAGPQPPSPAPLSPGAPSSWCSWRGSPRLTRSTRSLRLPALFVARLRGAGALMCRAPRRHWKAGSTPRSNGYWTTIVACPSSMPAKRSTGSSTCTPIVHPTHGVLLPPSATRPAKTRPTISLEPEPGPALLDTHFLPEDGNHIRYGWAGRSH